MWIGPFLCLVLTCASADAATIEITHHFMDSEVKLKVDNSRIDVATLKRYLVIHPVGYDPEYYIAPSVNQCIEGQVGYKDCGTRDFHAKYFLENAEHNIQLAKQRLSYLNELKDFPELQPLVDYFRSSLEFGIWLNQRLTEYYQTWDPTALEQDFKGLPVVNETRQVLSAIRRTTDADSRWHLSLYEWHNIANRLYRAQEGEIPKDVWERFVRDKQIVESLEFDEVD